MARLFLKKARRKPGADAPDVARAVRQILGDIEDGGEDAARRWAAKFDRYEGEIVLGPTAIARAADALPSGIRDDITFVHDNIRRFAEAQRATICETEIEVMPGLIAGQRLIPVDCAGCYVPGGRYSHVASALMTVTTARAAGCSHVVACSPPRGAEGVPPAIAFAAHLAGADSILAMGGVQGIAAMAFGLFGIPPASILVGPGNQYVAEAKRLLFGRVGIDMVAGPTDSLILADASADPEIVAVDLVGQAEHGWNSPVWLVTDDQALGEAVRARVPTLIDALPEPNRDSARAAWEDFAEIVLCDGREEMAEVSDAYAPEHLSVQAGDLDWWLGRLANYGSLFLGEETTVAFGDKATGPNHVLPTSGAARYTGGLSVHKFLKVVTWQRATRDGMRRVAEATGRLSRLEGMEAHARSADARLAKYFGDNPTG